MSLNPNPDLTAPVKFALKPRSKLHHLVCDIGVSDIKREVPVRVLEPHEEEALARIRSNDNVKKLS